MSSAKRTKTIKTDFLARVEGEGAMLVKVADGAVDDVQLKIYEPPRFFEAFLRGRGFTEAPDITARICGICPVAYQMSAVHAMEQALRRRGRRPAARPAAPSLLRRVDREPRAPRVHAPPARLPRLRERDRAGEGPAATLVAARPRAEEDRQRGDDGHRRPRDPSRQRPRRRLLPRAADASSCAPLRREARARAGDRARGGSHHGRPRLPGLPSRLRARLPRPSPASTRSTAAASSPTRGSTSRSASTTTTSSRSTFPGRTRSTRDCASAGAYLVGPLARFALGFDELSSGRA